MDKLEYTIKISPNVMEGTLEGNVAISFDLALERDSFCFHQKDIEILSVLIDGQDFNIAEITPSESEKDLYKITYQFSNGNHII